MKGIFCRAGTVIMIAALMFTVFPPSTVGAANGPTCYVNDDASGGNNGNSWTDAYTSLQTALADANCTEIWVAAGVYKPGAARTDAFTLKNGVAVYGGFAGTETSRSQRDWQTNLTILNGDIDNNDMHGGDFINENATQIVGSNSYHVVTASNLNNTAKLDGFIITAGQANGSFPSTLGGGMYNYLSSPTLKNITFSGNTAERGGGMFNDASDPTLTDVVFSGNRANYGGGLYNEESDPVLSNLTFIGNSAVNNGGGMFNNYSSPPLTNAAFSGNFAQWGGGMVNSQSITTLTNVTFSGNSATNGGGMFNNASSPTLVNVIIWGNSGGSIFNVAGSTANVSYSDIQGGYSGTGNIDLDPLFIDSDGADDATGTPDDNLRLQMGSPAIDAGKNSAVPSGVTTDLDGKPRFWDIPAVSDTGSGTPPIVDMGAYETGLLYAAPNTAGSGNCFSWANACTLQTALSIAASGNEIWVKGGVHYPGTASSDTFALINGVAIYGGFAGTETSRDDRDWQANPTILSGDIDQDDTNTDGNNIAETTSDIQGNNAYHVVTGSGTDNTAVLDGFIITAGKALTGISPNESGGGVYNNNGSPTLTNIIFSGNWATNYGGGMFNFDSSPVLTDVIFSGNSVGFGGGMYNESSSPTLTNVIFSDNSASGNGGGMYGHNSTPVLTNVTFSGNSASNGGGMFDYGDNSAPVLNNVTFSGNSAGNGGGMYNYINYPTLNNVIIWGNTATFSGPGVYNNGGTPTISYSDIEGCGGSGSWNSACGTDGGGNIDANPLFVDADGADNTYGTADDNLHLQWASPAIDAGDNTAVPSGVTTDLDGNPRFIDVPTVSDTGSGTPPIVDMGAYETQVIKLFLPLILKNAP